MLFFNKMKIIIDIIAKRKLLPVIDCRDHFADRSTAGRPERHKQSRAKDL
jgi:hypothetical protein